MQQGNRLQRAAEQTRIDAARSIVHDFPAPLQNALLSEWERNRHADGEPFHQNYIAYLRLRQRRDQLEEAHSRIAFDEDQISAKAARCARFCLRARSIEMMESICEGQGIEPPSADAYPEQRGRINRMRCEKWWRRQLHRHYSRAAEGAMRELGLVHRKAGLYCSDATVKRRSDQKSRQRDLLREIVAVNDLGDQLTLFELAQTSVSNPALRRAELMTRIRGFEEVAEAAGHVAEFYTFTTPSRFHPYHYSGERNDRYTSELTPRDAQAWLRLCWSRIRAKLRRLSISVYGFRVAEPHHDGTTHWHLLLFMPKRHAGTVRAVCEGYLLADEGGEPGASKHRFVAVSIDAAKGTAAGYIAKYVAKNIDGFEVGEDWESDDDTQATDTSARVDAWASTWGIRQFQQIGGPSVGIWRELRRIRDVDGIKHSLRAIEAARLAADSGDWAAFINSLGGIEVRNGDMRLAKRQTGECNEYGELKAAVIIGVKRGLTVVLTRLRVWTFAFRDRVQLLTRVQGAQRRGPARRSEPKRGPPTMSERDI